MSLIYIKSDKFIKDINNQKIPLSGELPYQFTSQFKEPIEITPKSKIELISADLNIESVHEISNDRLNDSYSFGFGEEEAVGSTTGQAFQTPVKLTDGRYTNDLLTEEIKRVYDNSNLLDNMKLNVRFDNAQDKFLGTFEIEDYTLQNNTYGLISQKMGYLEPDSSLQTGIGTRTSQTVTIYNDPNQTSFEDDIFDMTDSNITLSGTPSNKLLPVNLLSNIATPTSNGSGINNFDGVVCSVITPTKMTVFPSDWSTSFTGDFDVTINGVTTACTFNGGTAGYDFKIVGVNQGKYEGKLVYNKSQWNTSPRPDIGFTYDTAGNIDMTKLPYGQLLIINDHTVVSAPQTVLKDNQIVLIWKGLAGWQLFYADPTLSITQFTIYDNEELVIGESSQTVSMGFYTGGIALARGETALTGTNQMNTTNKFTRTRVENILPTYSEIEVDSKIYADYSLQICPHKNKQNESMVIMRYGTQDETKVAGDVGWLTIPDASVDNCEELSDVLDLDPEKDNIIIVAQMLDYRNVKFSIGHDTAGDGKFGGFQVLGDTTADEVDVNYLPINFNQSSYPIMPIVLPGNGYVSKELLFGGQSFGQETYVVGKYSKFKCGEKNLQTIRSKVNTDFGQNYNIPLRQRKSTITSFGDLTDFLESSNLEFNGYWSAPIEQPINTYAQGTRNENIEIDFSTTSTFSDGGNDYDNTSNSPWVIRFGQAGEDDKQELKSNGLNEQPDLITKLNRNLGYTETDVLKQLYDAFEDGGQYISNLNSNYIINIENLGNIKGQNSGTKTISRMIGFIPSAELELDQNSGTKHFVSQYPNPVAINAKTDEKVNNFMINITDDENYPAQDLRHPINLLVKISE